MNNTFSVATGKALLKFASSDKSRPNLYGIGVTQQGLAATDGFAAVEFHLGHDNIGLVGTVLDRKVFEVSVKLAAVTKSELILGDCVKKSQAGLFPDMRFFMTSNSKGFEDCSIKLNPGYLALLDLVAVACETDSVSLACVKYGEPLRFIVQGTKQSATVVINHAK